MVFYSFCYEPLQVQQFEDQASRATTPPPQSIYWTSPQCASSHARLLPPTPNLAVSLGLQSVSHSRLCRPRTGTSATSSVSTVL